MKDNLDTLPKESGDQLIADFKLGDELNILSKENEDKLNTRVKREDELSLLPKEKEDELNGRSKREDELNLWPKEKEDELNTRFKRGDNLNPWSSLPSLLLSLQHPCASLLILNPTYVPRNLVNALLPRIQTQVQLIKISLISTQKTLSGCDKYKQGGNAGFRLFLCEPLLVATVRRSRNEDHFARVGWQT